MGYEVHITRKVHQYDEQGPTITQADWEAYVASDPDLRLDGYAEVTMPTGSTVRITNPGIAAWTAHPSGARAWIALGSDGNLRVNNPDDTFIRKMWQIAQSLGARVVGDDETYDQEGQPEP